MSREKTSQNDMLIDVKETARLLGVRPRTVYHMLKTDDGPPHIRLGGLIKFRRQSVEAWLEEQEQ